MNLKLIFEKIVKKRKKTKLEKLDADGKNKKNLMESKKIEKKRKVWNK